MIPIERSLTQDPVQAMFCGAIGRMHEAREAMAGSGIEKEITVLRTEYPVRDLSIVDVLNQGCSKGHALERWAKYRGIPREQVMAIGDNYNDIEMLAFAGLPFIMGQCIGRATRQGLGSDPAERSERGCGCHRAGSGAVKSERVKIRFPQKSMQCRRRRGRVLLLALLFGSSLYAFSADIAVLTNGFSIRHEHREVLGAVTRLYLSKTDQAGYVDIPTSEIAEFEPDLTPASAAPSVASEVIYPNWWKAPARVISLIRIW